MTLDAMGSYHYQVIKRAIREIDEADRQLSLEELASRMFMSTSHFQRTFSRWVGLSPKRYQQYLTLNHAKRLLRQRTAQFETASKVGLSSAGRLNDLFVKWEAMSPRQFARGGSGLTISYGWFDSPFGDMLAMGTHKGLCGLAFSSSDHSKEFEDMSNRWPKAELTEDAGRIVGWTEALFTRSGSTRAVLVGAPFQIKVWEALLRIPEGHVTTYGDVALAVGNPTASRAVGNAVGRNPLSWLIPCHRVLRKNGQLGGYHWGPVAKRAMLAWEAARFEAAEASRTGLAQERSCRPDP
ncbi:MAG: bifunctional helix-turn-helix domain-containing protein/methylated-DNA--[protein]-cysteine S-methyltransferase [Rhodobacteraceae bacterium]|nr:bifunctional helix-turn-helix domain-containing protein/methylated-DNA--[protein]-cysteine S-methyltransferase [Paracoccaceae bacterium]